VEIVPAVAGGAGGVTLRMRIVGTIGDVKIAGAIEDDARWLIEVRRGRRYAVFAGGPGAISAGHCDRVAGNKHCQSRGSSTGQQRRTEFISGAIH
jgi:hypothetical protein